MKRFLLNLLVFLVAVGLLAAAGYVAFRLYKTRPRAKRQARQEEAMGVETIVAQLGETRVIVVARGSVMPARSVALQPEVSGRVVEQHAQLVDGGFIREGEPVVRLFDEDYKLAIEQAQGNLARAKFELAVEEGRRVIAQREWELLEGDVPNSDAGRALALREPHIENAQAVLKAAESSLALSRISLDRTTVVCPFNALVREEFVDTGQLVTPQTLIATLVGTDVYWVRVSVPLEDLHFITVPGAGDDRGSSARIVCESGNAISVEYDGRVIRLLGDLDPAGRMARVLIEVTDPLGLKTPRRMPLLLNAYVRAEIQGALLEDVFVLRREALREGNEVWVANGEDRLERRNVKVLWGTQATVAVRGDLETGDRVIVSPLTEAVPGRRLQVAASTGDVPSPTGEVRP